MDDTIAARRDAYLAGLIEKHGGDAEGIVLEACMAVIVKDDHAKVMQRERAAREAYGESWGYLRKGNAYAVSRLPKPPIKPLDVAPDDSPHG